MIDSTFAGMRLDSLSKIVSQALRHEPEFFGLTLDEYGWVKLSDLIKAFNDRGLKVMQHDVFVMIEKSVKKRHEIRDGKIRARYGHSTAQKIIKQPVRPPYILFHGTSEVNITYIMNKGLMPMTRQYVHLSIDEKTAKLVGSRKRGKTIVIQVLAEQAYKYGLEFYEEENDVWLSERIPLQFIEIDYGTN